MASNKKDTICNEKVFAELYDKYAKDLHDYLYYKYGYQSNINDKIQEAFIKLWKNCINVAHDKARAYLFKVSKNMMLNEFKHQKIVLKHRQIKPKSYTNEDPEFLLQEKEFLNRYEKALASLKEEQRVAFLLNKVEGKRHKEIAEMLGVTRRVVESRIYTAFKKIKEQVEGFK
jgi:RNA polymerase sigma-70 factor (ECF subfamily)